MTGDEPDEERIWRYVAAVLVVALAVSVFSSC